VISQNPNQRIIGFTVYRLFLEMNFQAAVGHLGNQIAAL